MKLDFTALTSILDAEPGVCFATLFGSSRAGEIRDGGDVDVGVFLVPKPTPLEFYSFYQRVTSRVTNIPDLDLVDLANANSILAFEALCGLRILVRDPEALAAFASRMAREYEDDMLHATHAV